MSDTVSFRRLKLTRTQTEIINILRDGEPHHFDELFRCLPDELSGRSALGKHISEIRSTLRPLGYDVMLLVGSRGTHYQIVKLLRNI